MNASRELDLTYPQVRKGNIGFIQVQNLLLLYYHIRPVFRESLKYIVEGNDQN